jgi:hypothetical protein
MDRAGYRKYKIAGILAALAWVGFLYQNMTTLDFTQEPQKRSKPTSLERAISRSDNERQHGQKKMGLDDRQIQKKYIKKQRNPNAVVGDLSVDDAEKDKKLRKNKKLKRKAKER